MLRNYRSAIEMPFKKGKLGQSGVVGEPHVRPNRQEWK